MIKNLIIPTKQNNYKPLFCTRVAMVVLTLWVLLMNSLSGVLINNFGIYATNISTDRIIQLTNEERISRGLKSVNSNALLTSAAHAKANNMFEQQYWDHFGPNGESPWQFINAAGYSYVYAGENLAKGFSTSEGVHQAWMASPTHKENIISPNYQDIGIAIVSGVLNGENVVLVVQMFGSLSQLVQEEPVIQSEPKQEEVKVTPEPKPVPAPTPAPTPRQEPYYIQGDSEDDRTKSIRIVYPEEGLTYTDPRIPIKGETTNFDPGSIIEIITDNSVIGETKVEKDDLWEFENLYDWKEGENNVDAVIVDKEQKYRGSVSFFVHSSPPEILGVNVKKTEDSFDVSIFVDETATEISLIMGDKIIEGEIVDGETKFVISEEELENSMSIVVSDIHGNFAQKDISSYFVEKDGRGKFSLGGFINFNVSSIQRTITVLLVVIVFAILLLQMYFYKKANKLKEQTGDFLMVGVWWLIFLFGSFIGYSGTIY